MHDFARVAIVKKQKKTTPTIKEVLQKLQFYNKKPEIVLKKFLFCNFVSFFYNKVEV